MEDKKLLIVGIIMVIVGAITATVLYLMRTKTKLTSKIVKIEYSFSSNYGTMLDCAKYTVTIEKDGTVTLNNSYHEDYQKTFSISTSEYDRLATYIEKNIKVFDIENRTDNDVMDGGSSNVKITLEDGKTHETGGSNPSGKDYSNLTLEIINTINYDKIKEYKNEVKNLGEKKS